MAAARALWKGTIVFESLEVSVKLYSGIQDHGVRFRLLHQADGEPVKRRMVEPSSGEVVPYEATRRGHEVDDGVFVLLEPEELDALQPESSRDIEVLQFVPPEAINAAWYLRPYFVGPDGHEDRYAALVQALESSRKHGIVRWVMRNKEYVGALRARNGHLMLMTLRHANEVIAASSLPRPAGKEPTAKEVRLAEQLVEALEGQFDVEAFEDEYRLRVMDLVAHKAKGETMKLGKPHAKPGSPDTSLVEVLQASLEQRKGKRVA